MSQHEDKNPPSENEEFSADDLMFTEMAEESAPAGESPSEHEGEMVEFITEFEPIEAAEDAAAQAKAADDEAVEFLSEPTETAEVAEPVEAAASGAEPAATGEELSEFISEPAEPADKEKKKGKEKKKKEKPPKAEKKKLEAGAAKKWLLHILFHVPWAVAAGLCVFIYLFLIASGVQHALWHAVYLISLVVLATTILMTRRIWAKFSSTAFYTIALGCSLAAVLTGVYYLGLELYVQNWDTAAQQSKQAAQAAQRSAMLLTSPPVPISPTPKSPVAKPPAKAPAKTQPAAKGPGAKPAAKTPSDVKAPAAAKSPDKPNPSR